MGGRGLSICAHITTIRSYWFGLYMLQEQKRKSQKRQTAISKWKCQKRPRTADGIHPWSRTYDMVKRSYVIVRVHGSTAISLSS